MSSSPLPAALAHASLPAPLALAPSTGAAAGTARHPGTWGMAGTATLPLSPFSSLLRVLG